MSHLLIVSKVLKFVKSLKTNKNVTLLMPSGFRSFNDHLGQMEGLSHLQEREFTSTDWQGGRGGHSAFRKEYQKYKEEYVKQLQFGSESYGKRRVRLSHWMIFWKNSKRPSTLPPLFRKTILQIFFYNEYSCIYACRCEGQII